MKIMLFELKRLVRKMVNEGLPPDVGNVDGIDDYPDEDYDWAEHDRLDREEQDEEWAEENRRQREEDEEYRRDASADVRAGKKLFEMTPEQLKDEYDDLQELRRDCGCYGAGVDSQCNTCWNARTKQKAINKILYNTPDGEDYM